jgi:hypothetical protein
VCESCHNHATEARTEVAGNRRAITRNIDLMPSPCPITARRRVIVGRGQERLTNSVTLTKWLTRSPSVPTRMQHEPWQR